MVHKPAPLIPPMPILVWICSPTLDGYPYADRCELAWCVVCLREIWFDPATPVTAEFAELPQWKVCNDEACWGLLVRQV